MQNNVYLIVEPNSIIASDLALSVQDFHREANVLTAVSHEEAIERLTDIVSVQLAFIHMDPHKFDKTDLARCLVARGARLVYIGGAAEQSEAGRLVLHRPFTQQSTADLLHRIETSVAA